MDYKAYRETKILRYIDSIKNGWRTFPPSLQIALTDHCFNSCPMCGHHRMKDKYELRYDKLMKLLEFGAKNGLETVCYSGGDPFLWDNYTLNQVMLWHIDNKVNFGFITAGEIAGPIDLDLLRHASFVRCSFDSVNKDYYKMARGGSITADMVTGSIKDMLAAEVKVGLGITLTKLNQPSLYDTLKWASHYKVPEVRLWIVRNEPNLLPKYDQDTLSAITTMASLFDVADVDHNLHEAADIYSGHCETLPFVNCYACLYQLFIKANGDIMPCCITAGDTEASSHCEPFGNINVGEPNLYWHNVHKRAKAYSEKSLRSLPDICSTNCIMRLSTANHFADYYWENKNFI